jgi:hypothetical protein
MRKWLISPACSLCIFAYVFGLTLPLQASSKKAAPSDHPTVRATLQPNLTIPAEPLGFSSPGQFYLGMRNSLASLDFLDENRLLFTFRVPGLLHRNGSNEDSEGQRQIRAIVIRLPEGTIESENVWTLHDRAHYLYMLDHGQFLLRDGNSLLLGDASLQLKPFLRFPGPVLWVEVDPTRQYLVVGSSEPPNQKHQAGDVDSPASAAAHVDGEVKHGFEDPDMVLRILRRESGKVMLVSHVNSAVHLPINAEGYLETLRSKGSAWSLNFNHFSGGSTIIGSVDSVCSPFLDFVSPAEFLVTACGNTGDPALVAMSMSGRHLWQAPSVGPAVWPLFVINANGTRIARESLLADHAVNASAPLGTDDIKGQDVQVIDAATGKVALRAAASPILDAGGNVAISPSGARVAILMESNLQIFDLPVPPPVPGNPAPANPAASTQAIR